PSDRTDPLRGGLPAVRDPRDRGARDPRGDRAAPARAHGSRHRAGPAGPCRPRHHDGLRRARAHPARPRPARPAPGARAARPVGVLRLVPSRPLPSVTPEQAMRPTDVIHWLLDTDPALRWQVERALLDAPEEQWQATRARIPQEGYGAALLDRQDPATGLWAG